MSSITVNDVLEKCRNGVFRVCMQGDHIILEDRHRGESVILNKEQDRERKESIRNQHGSRTEHLFGERETWSGRDQEQEEDRAYRGFLIIECEDCGAVKAFCAKKEIYGFRCHECGHETALEKMRPVYMHCKCGATFRYRTNMQNETFTHRCLQCNSPVDMELNGKKTAYVTVGERR